MTEMVGLIRFSGTGIAETDGPALPAGRRFGAWGGPAILRDALPPLLPDRIELGALRDARLKVIEPIGVTVSKSAEHIVVEAHEVGEVGWGANLGEAIADLQRAIAELYLSLEAEHERLGPDLASTWSILRRKVARRA